MILWMNGKYINETEIKISPFDHGYLYGLNFFEKFRTYKGKVVLFQEHFHRLLNKLNEFHIKMPYSSTDILQVIRELTRNSNEQDGIFLLNVSAGNCNNELQFQTRYNQPNIIIYRNELLSRKRGLEKSAQWVNIQGHTSSYINKYLASLEISNLENCEGFFLTPRGIITEGVTSNIFWAKDEILYTPSLKTGIVQGIIRQWVINTAKQIGYRVVEDIFIQKDLEQAYECIITNSVDELVPISNIENKMFLGGDGPVYQLLHQAYIDEILRTVKKGE